MTFEELDWMVTFYYEETEENHPFAMDFYYIIEDIFFQITPAIHFLVGAVSGCKCLTENEEGGK